MQLEAGLVAGGLHPVTASPSPSRSAHHSGATSVLGREDLGQWVHTWAWDERISTPPALSAGQGGTWGQSRDLRTGLCSLGPWGSPYSLGRRHLLEPPVHCPRC